MPLIKRPFSKEILNKIYTSKSTKDINDFKININSNDLFIIEERKNQLKKFHLKSIKDKTRNYSQKEIFIKPLLPGGTIYNHLVSKIHMENCDTSCYDCLRDYHNQSEHKVLNWRLALDLAQISNNSDYTPSLFSEYWESLTNRIINSYEKHIAISNITVVIENNEDRILIVHPLWSDSYIKFLIEDNNLGNVIIRSILELLTINKLQ